MKKLNLVEDADLVTRIYDAIYNVTEDPVHKVEEDGKISYIILKNIKFLQREFFKL